MPLETTIRVRSLISPAHRNTGERDEWTPSEWERTVSGSTFAAAMRKAWAVADRATNDRDECTAWTSTKTGDHFLDIGE